MAKPEKPRQNDAERQAALQPGVEAAVGTLAQLPATLAVSAQLAIQQQTGPIPPPEILERYNKVYPGLAKQIVEMAQDEGLHRRAMEKSLLDIQGRDQIAYRRSEVLGQVFGTVIGIAGLAAATACAIHGAQVAASVIGGSTVTTLVVAFILGRHYLLKIRQQEHQERQAATPETHQKD